MKTINFKNLTPHALTIYVDGDQFVQLAPFSTVIPRITVERVPGGAVGGIPVFRNSYGKTENLPDYEEGVYLIVSAMVVTANPGRSDLYSPGELVRNEAGAVIGCRGLTY